MKPGAFIEDKEGRRFDVNTDYLFDPKMSTYVLVPSNAKLRVISPKAIRSVYIVANDRVMVTYNGWEYGAKIMGNPNTELKSYFVELDGSSNIIDIYSFDKTKDIKIYYMTFQEINITMDVFAHIAGTSTERVLFPTHSTAREISDVNKAFYKLEPIVEFMVNELNGSGYAAMPISVLKFQGKNTIIFSAYGLNILQEDGSFYYLDVASYAVADLDNDGYKEIYLAYPPGFFAIIYEKNPRIQPVAIDVSDSPKSPDGFLVLLGAGDIDSDGADELILYSGVYPYQEVGYIKLNKNRYEYHPIYSHLEISGSVRMVDFVVTDYDGDGINELYLVGVGQVYKVWNDRGEWKVTLIKLEFGYYDDASYGYYHMVYFNTKIYVKSAYHLYSIAPDFTIESVHVLPGIGLRVMNFMGKKYLVTGGVIMPSASGGEVIPAQ